MMHVRDIGDGPPVVLLHPGPGLDGSVFLPGAEHLARSHRLLIADLPGNGRSEDGDRAEWSLLGYARAVEALVSELGLRDWTLLGHSFGGYVAMRHLVEFPGSASRLVASCTDASEDPAAEEDWYRGLAPDVVESVQAAEALAERAASPEELHTAWLGMAPVFAADPTLLEPMLADVVYRPDVARSGEWGELQALDALAAADIPVLAIGGEEDRASPPEAARRIADTAPRGDLLLLDGLGHFPFAEAPERYWPALEEWLLSTSG
jgi:pimeloyl-ACP methyl ester carboxylesterase